MWYPHPKLQNGKIESEIRRSVGDLKRHSSPNTAEVAISRAHIQRADSRSDISLRVRATYRKAQCGMAPIR